MVHLFFTFNPRARSPNPASGTWSSGWDQEREGGLQLPEGEKPPHLFGFILIWPARSPKQEKPARRLTFPRLEGQQRNPRPPISPETKESGPHWPASQPSVLIRFTLIGRPAESQKLARVCLCFGCLRWTVEERSKSCCVRLLPSLARPFQNCWKQTAPRTQPATFYVHLFHGSAFSQ